MTNRLSPRQIAVAAVVGALVLVNLVILGIGRLTPAPSGPPSSSYATAPEGVAAYAELLTRSGYRIRRVREELGEAQLDRGSTVVVLDPDHLSDEDTQALDRFVAGGGRLVAGGSDPLWLDGLLTSPPTWSPEQERTAEPVVPVPGARGVRNVELCGFGVWEDAGEALPVLAGARGVVAVASDAGQGRMMLLADPSLLQNRCLGRADNAAFALALAGDRDRPVLFVESVHGYGAATGIGAFPDRWLYAFGGFLLAALVFLWARGRRLGPPEAEHRTFPPPRRDYVESLGALLARTKRRGEAVQPLQAAARARLERRAALAADADPDALRAAGARLGLSEDELAAILEPVSTSKGVLAAGSALARLERAGVKQ